MPSAMGYMWSAAFTTDGLASQTRRRHFRTCPCHGLSVRATFPRPSP